jgi:hypothetical protein
LNETKTNQQDFHLLKNQQLIEYDEKEHLKKFVEKIKEKVLIYLFFVKNKQIYFVLLKEKEKCENMNENFKKEIKSLKLENEISKRQLNEKEERIQKLIEKNCYLEGKLNC